MSERNHVDQSMDTQTAKDSLNAASERTEQENPRQSVT